MIVETIIPNGRERVVMDRDVYEDLVDARDHAVAMRDLAGGGGGGFPAVSGTDRGRGAGGECWGVDADCTGVGR